MIRVYELAARKDIYTQAALARLLNTSSQKIKNWENRGISKEGAFQVAREFNVDARYIYNMEDLTQKKQSKVVSINHKLETFNNATDEITINQYSDAHGSMGVGIVLQDQPGQIKKWTVNKEWVNKNLPHHTKHENLAIVTGFGDSMKGMYNSGDPLIIDIGVKTLEYDGVYFFRVGDEGFIKRLQRIPGEGIRVISKNPEYESWTIKPDMDFEVIGRVLKVWKSEEY